MVVDKTRVVLTPIEGAEHDYINANFIDVSYSNWFKSHPYM